MEKPITVVMEEYQDALVALTNEAELPNFLKAQIVKNLLAAINEVDMKEREQARNAWAESQKEEAEKETVSDKEE